MTRDIPQEIVQEYSRKKKDFPACWIGFNANIDKYSVYIIPKSWTNSLMITHVPVWTISEN